MYLLYVSFSISMGKKHANFLYHKYGFSTQTYKKRPLDKARNQGGIQ